MPISKGIALLGIDAGFYNFVDVPAGPPGVLSKAGGEKHSLTYPPNGKI